MIERSFAEKKKAEPLLTLPRYIILYPTTSFYLYYLCYLCCLCYLYGFLTRPSEPVRSPVP